MITQADVDNETPKGCLFILIHFLLVMTAFLGVILVPATVMSGKGDPILGIITVLVGLTLGLRLLQQKVLYWIFLLPTAFAGAVMMIASFVSGNPEVQVGILFGAVIIISLLYLPFQKQIDQFLRKHLS